MGGLVRDDETAPCLYGGAGEVVVGLEGFDGDLETLGDLLKRVPHTDAIPVPRVRFVPDLPDLNRDREWRELMGGGTI